MSSLRIILDTKDHKWNLMVLPGVYQASMDIGGLDCDDDALEDLAEKLALLLLASIRDGT
jgi:hypothetical protein